VILSRGKIVIIAIFVAIVAGLAGLITFTGQATKEVEGKVAVTLENVKMKSLDEQTKVMTLQVDFNVTNNADMTLTISKIDYELFANEKSLGQGFLSYESAPLVGRPPLFSDASTTLPSDFKLNYSEEVSDVWNLLAASPENDSISWKAKGTAEIESALDFIPIEFESSI
jgi:LEA14-like dessication related protein